MKKKVFSLMMMLLLAFVGFVRADELTVNDGTTTNGFVPVYGFYADAYLKCEFVQPAADLAAVNGGTINSLTFFASDSNVSWGNANFQVFVTEVADASISAFAGPGTVVYTGALSIANGQMVVNFTTPYTYNGGNLLVGVYNTVTGSYVSCSWYGVSATGASVQGYSYSSLTDITASQRNFLPKMKIDYTAGGGGGGGSMEDMLHVKYMEGEEEIIDSLNLGVRPIGAWMEPFNFTMYSEGPTYTVTVLDFTPSDGMFSVEGAELPFTVNTDGVELTMATNTEEGMEAGIIERQFVAITEGDRAAHIWPLVVEFYAPEIPDVVEKAYDLGTIDTEYTYECIPSQITPTELHNDYTLPFPEIEEGVDAVYKFTVENDMVLNAYVDPQAENGKVALYTEDFYGEGGPMATNNYTGLTIGGGGGAAGAPFEAQIGEGTSTSGYFPFYSLYNYSIAAELFLAAELSEAGVTTAPFTSLSWNATNSISQDQNNITIWMANVSDTQIPATSPLASGMTKVYTGNMTQPTPTGWVEFVFNEGSFAWDGHSNVMILCQRNNGSWTSSIQWQYHNPGFQARGYDYTDNAAYDVTTTAYSWYTSSTTRSNVIMKGGNRSDISTLSFNFEGGVSGWTNIDNDGDGETWYHSSLSGSYSCYDYTGYGNNGSDGFMISQSYTDCTYDSYDADNYLVSPQKYSLGNGASLNFYFDYANDVYPDYFEVCVATANNPAASDFTSVWNVDMRGRAAKTEVRHTNNRMENWREVTVDLSAYAGQEVWLAFHHQDYDEYEVFIDDVTINTGEDTPTPPTPPTPAEGEVSAGPVIENLPLTAGVYYLVASATQPDYTVYINTAEMPCPAIEAEGFAFNPEPADDADEIEPASVTLRWMVPEFATGWRLVFGSTYYPDPNHPQTVMYPEDGSFSTDMANSYTVRNLWNNTNYFWHVEFNNGGCPEGVSSPIWGFTTHLNIPQNLTAADETVFDDEQIVLNWTAVVDRTYRFYNVYRDGELIGNTQVNNISNTTFTDGPLEYNMNGYTYYVTAVYDEGESAPSNTVNVKVSGRGNVSGHVYEQDGTTGIAGATVTMVGQDEFGVNHTYNFTTNAQGYYSGAVYAGPGYDGQAAKDGYQTAYEPVQGEPIVIVYNETTSPIDYILDENFDPVCTVIAEYYPDSLDPESPYVKVYWGCGLPGEEIIEPFETGDFSLFDWQIDPTYPWVIDNQHAYEGTYCMKSGNQQVLESTSTMQVTVNIPADGIMSFFGKISCESGWDYGYFYIDGVQKGSYTGEQNWAEKKFDITAGDHTFKWEYTEDYIISQGDDCFYVDYITFYKRPEPAQPGWHTYCESEFNNAVGSNLTTTPSWAYEYPASFLHTNYAGWNITKVSLFSDNMYNAVGGNYTCRIYVGGNEPAAGTMVSTITVDVPSGQNAWVDWDLTTPVNVTGTDPIWVVWTANSTVSSWPAGCCGDLNDLGTWWDGGSGWEHLTYGTWTMRHWFTNRAGRSVAVEAADVAPTAIVDANPINSNLRTSFPKGGDTEKETVCANPNAVKGAALSNDANRSLDHYRVYRTNCYNDGPYTEENTVLLATVWVPDTVYIDVEWADLEPGVYKWGVGAVYSGNRGEMIEAPINWTAPQAVNMTRSFGTAEANQHGPKIEMEMPEPTDNRDYLQYCTETFSGGVGTGGGAVYWGIRFPAADLAAYAGQTLTKVGIFMDIDGDYGWTYSGSYTANVFQGGATAPGTLVSTATETLPGDMAWHDITLTTPVTIDATQDLWLCFYTPDIAYPMAGCDYVGEPNSDFLSLDGTVWEHAGDYGLGYTWMIRGTVENGGGPGPGPAPTPGTNLNQLALPRESETIWSNCLDKDMYIIGENQDGVTVNVLLNSADSPEGVQVTFTNYNEAEQELYPVDPITLDETGFYAFESFRKGEYNVKVEFDGYEPIEDSVSIWAPTDLRYVMTEIIYGVSDLYVSSTGWAMWDAEGMPTPGGGGGGGGQGGNGDTFSDDFESGLGNWTLVDADADGHNWYHSSMSQTYSCYDYTGWGHNGTNGFAVSQSYTDCTYDSYDPNNFMITNQKYSISASSTLNFWADYGNDSYPDHFGVAVATVDNPTPADFTIVWEGTAKAGNAGKTQVRHDGERYQNWRSHSVNLGAYAGQDVYIAFRHFNSYDQYEIYIDDVELTNGAKDGDRHLEYFKVMCTSIDGEPIFNADTENPFCQVATDELVEGNHYIAKVAAVYSTGMSAWTECEWQYIPCTNYAGTLNGITIEGNTVSWDYPNGGTPGPGPGGSGDTFSVDFEAGMPAGWTTIDGGNPSGYGWQLASNKLGTGYGHNGSVDCVLSQSYDNNYGVVYPDNYLVSPQVTLAAGSTFSFWACGQDASYAAEHFGVFVSDNGTGNWTMVNEWTIGQKGERYSGPRGQRDQSAWTLYSVDLSNFAGQKYVAIRHFNCSDMFYLDVDDIELSNGAKSDRNPWDLMMTFNAAEAAQYGVAYDGNNFYTSNWGYSSATHNFFKYDLQGNMLEGFEIAGCGTLRGMTYDGQYTYGVANSNTVYCIDLAAHNLVSTFTTSYGAMRGITYDPERDGFWVIGNWSGNLTLIDRQGTILQTGPAPESASDLAYYKDENDVEHVFCFNNGTNDVVDWVIGNTSMGGSVFNFSAVPGFNAGSSGGCTVASFNNKIAFIGDIQQDPNLIGIYELRDDTNPGPGPGPQPSGDILGAMIFVDGEWEAFVEAPTNSYTYEGDGNEVCVRMVYNGTNNLPEGNIYYSMSCPECVEPNPGCAPGEPIHAEVDNTTDEVTVWWGEQPTPPAQPIEEWLYYDDGANVDAIGLTNGGSFYWGIKFPAASLSQYVGCSVTKIAYFDYTAHTGTVRIYNGSNGNAPGTLIGTYNYTANGTEDWAEWTIPAVAFDNTQDLWIVMNNAGGQYVASMGNYTGDPNGTMISTDGSTWYTLDEATGGSISGTWNLRCFVSNQAKGEVAVLDEKGNGTPNGVFANAGVAKVGGSAPMNPVRATMVQYNVYRSTDNETYEMIGSVPYVEGQTYYEYVDAPGAGNYYYQVRALYDNDCESEPAPAFDDPTHNYVTASVDAVNENSDNVALYPNPTKGNVTIEAAGMSRITVVSVLGQVVYDTEVSEDTYVMNMSQFTAGMYMVRVYTESGVTVKRVTVMQ